jgi:hypothetical protein
VLSNRGCSNDVVDLLLSRRANPNALGKDRITPIELAAEYCDVPIVKTLLQHKADPNQFGKQSAVEHAADHRNLEMVTELLKAGANPNRYGEIPPLIAAMRRHEGTGESLPVVKLLLKYKADPNAVWQGESAAHVAKTGAEGLLYKTLLDAGAKPPGATEYEVKLEQQSEELRKQLRDQYGSPELGPSSSMARLKQVFGSSWNQVTGAENETTFEIGSKEIDAKGKVEIGFFTPNDRKVRDDQIPWVLCINDPFPGRVGGVGTGEKLSPAGWKCLDTLGNGGCPADFEEHTFIRKFAGHYSLQATTEKGSRKVKKVCYFDDNVTMTSHSVRSPF